ncbi:CDF family Co(II)/Ni(II) efflux transporter DmeF [Sphingomonas xanthus]|uniref:CDF family Co(II)/Ni(II) efflux transporter DmeF n=1 Tax=Sphingomonas xanthus TaxID=2594473 RepID=UPI001FE44C93|nr:CDF family Co(II)/Ni(II) efflux transporter DmeF [Sphingomonas xanthus]
MHSHEIDTERHNHDFLGANHGRNARRVGIAIGLSFFIMIAEIVAGQILGSMALLADGMHMATHVGAFAIAAAAYSFARKYRTHPRFTFGTGKLGDLAAFGSAVVLAFMAVLIAWESAGRFSSPDPVRYDEAIIIAVIGLAANIVTAILLQGEGSGHHHHHGAEGHHHDHNHRAAFLHVVADALTSVLAIAGLAAAKYAGWIWMDPAMGIVGAVIIGRWSIQLMRDSGAVLLDAAVGPALPAAIRERVETEVDRVADIHVWRVGPGHTAAILSLVSADPKKPGEYKARLSDLGELCHVTVEVREAA